MSEQSNWYVATGENQQGPFTAEQMVGFAKSGEIGHDSLVWSEGMDNWLPASEIDGLFPATSPATSPASAGRPLASAPSFETAPYGARPAAAPAPEQAANPYAPGSVDHVARGGDRYPPVGVGTASFGLWLGLWIGSVACMILPIFISAMASGSGEISDGVAMMVGILFLLGWLGTIFASILGYIYLYRAWRCLEFGGYARSTPGKAVGFMFIPFFNIYWMFQAIYGLAVDWNRTLDSYEDLRSGPRMSDGMFLTFCILLLVFYPLNLIFGPIVMAQMCTGINYFAYRPTSRSNSPLGFTLH